MLTDRNVIKRVLCSVIVFLMFMLLQTKIDAASTMVSMIAGQSKTIQTRKVERVAVGDPDVADFSVISSGEVRVVAKSEGSTTLEIWSENGKVKAYELQGDTKRIISYRNDARSFSVFT